MTAMGMKWPYSSLTLTLQLAPLIGRRVCVALSQKQVGNYTLRAETLQESKAQLRSVQSNNLGTTVSNALWPRGKMKRLKKKVQRPCRWLVVHDGSTCGRIAEKVKERAQESSTASGKK
jgi:hypothetical protein